MLPTITCYDDCDSFFDYPQIIFVIFSSFSIEFLCDAYAFILPIYGSILVQLGLHWIFSAFDTTCWSLSFVGKRFGSSAIDGFPSFLFLYNLRCPL